MIFFFAFFIFKFLELFLLQIFKHFSKSLEFYFRSHLILCFLICVHFAIISDVIDLKDLDFQDDMAEKCPGMTNQQKYYINNSTELYKVPREKLDEVMEVETRGLDFKGNVRYFCPRCNVRYIEYKYLKTHLKECGSIFECNECLQKFKQKRTFTAHMKKKHGVFTFVENTSTPTTNKNKQMC